MTSILLTFENAKDFTEFTTDGSPTSVLVCTNHKVPKTDSKLASVKVEYVFA